MYNTKYIYSVKFCVLYQEVINEERKEKEKKKSGR
jgi:hypothetical protein